MSELRADQIANRAGTGPVGLVGQSAAKAWINFDGTGSTNRASFNVSSRTNIATGQYSFEATNAFSSVNTAPIASHCADNTASSFSTIGIAANSLSLFRVGTFEGSFVNRAFIHASVQGDLA